MKASTNAIAKRCVRPSHGTPHNGSAPNSDEVDYFRIPIGIRKRFTPEQAFRLWYDRDLRQELKVE